MKTLCRSPLHSVRAYPSPYPNPTGSTTASILSLQALCMAKSIWTPDYHTCIEAFPKLLPSSCRTHISPHFLFTGQISTYTLITARPISILHSSLQSPSCSPPQSVSHLCRPFLSQFPPHYCRDHLILLQLIVQKYKAKHRQGQKIMPMLPY